jgi:hypothetical protein
LNGLVDDEELARGLGAHDGCARVVRETLEVEMEDGVFDAADLVWRCAGLTRVQGGEAGGEAEAEEEWEEGEHCCGWDLYEGRNIELH